MKCRVCAALQALDRVKADTVREAVRNGFNPFRDRSLISDYTLGMMSPGYPQRWAKSVLEGSDPDDWPVCERCLPRLRRFLALFSAAIAPAAHRHGAPFTVRPCSTTPN